MIPLVIQSTQMAFWPKLIILLIILSFCGVPYILTKPLFALHIIYENMVGTRNSNLKTHSPHLTSWVRVLQFYAVLDKIFPPTI